jgi:hypothetical protein
MVQRFRREALRRGARMSAAKALRTLLVFRSGAALTRGARRLAVEAPTARTYRELFWVERGAGNFCEADAALRRMLSIAVRVGDLDAAADAEHALGGRSTARSRLYCDRVGISRKLRKRNAAAAYAAVRRVKWEALRRGGHATALHCVRSLLDFAAAALDAENGVRLARELVKMERTSFSYLALALNLERVDRARGARGAFARALNLACAEGDLHRATKATAGLLRVGGEGLVARTELRWAMREAQKEPATAPAYPFLRATLGLLVDGAV